MIRKYRKKAALFLVVSIALEILVFNVRALLSLGAEEQYPEYHREGNIIWVSGMEGLPHYVYIGVDAQAAVKVTLSIQDEGNAGYYDLDPITIYPPVEKSKYLAVHSYGFVYGMKIVLDSDAETDVQITGIIYDAKVPWFISVFRIAVIFAGLCMVWILRPGSEIYCWEGKNWQKSIVAGILIFANIAVLLFLVRSNPAFLNPVWPYHQQYHQLAVSLSEGRLYIDAGTEAMREALGTLINPYDSNLRRQAVPDVDAVWDTCYYQGKFYVYFGVVPVLIFYLPYYLLFHGAFPTWAGVFICGAGIIGGMYYFLAQIRRRWFSGISFVSYLFLAFAAGNSLNLFCAMLHADFYYLPILMALCFSLWGLGLALSAAEGWEKGNRYIAPRLTAGGLCMALTAGCRPQFLVGSFLLIPILLPVFWEKRKQKQTWGRILSLALPYVVVAAGLMLYNYFRFGSVFDFGANYNLTTNDMTRRGMNPGRLPNGIFMYLFQPFSLKLNFPFAEVTPFYSEYLGSTIRDWTFGGALWTRPLLLIFFCLTCVKKELKNKKAFGFTVLSMAAALAVVFADTEMSGILNRYYTDFLWLLMIPAVVILFQMLEKYRDSSCFGWLTCFILAAGMWGVLYELAIAFRGSGLMNDNVHRYYMIRSFFQ